MNDKQPLRAAAYQRISEVLREGDEHGVRNQLADQQRTADTRGYQIVLTERDNDISAFTGKHRPGYERVMAAAARGEIDVILVFQTSRFWRNREERAKGIRLLREAGVSLIATRGPGLDLTTAYGRAMAGLLGEFDTMESEVKAERQQLANRAAVVAGLPRKGTPQPFGWLADRLRADLAEQEAIIAGCRAILAGGTLTGVARDWERRGLRPHQAPYGPLREHPWTRSSVREILANPRNAAIAMYKGEDMGRGQWEALVAEETWRAVRDTLRTSRWRRPTHGISSLLGSIAYCRCGNYVTGSSSANGLPAYRCNHETRNHRPGPHVAVKREEVDKYIAMAVTGALSDPGAIHLFTPRAEGDAGALIDEEAALHNRLARLGGLYATGQISEADLIGGRQRGHARLAEIAADLADLGRESVLAPLITAADVAAAWEGLGLDLKRAVVSALMTVTLYPSGRGARTFDPGKVLPPGQGIKWKALAG